MGELDGCASRLREHRATERVLVVGLDGGTYSVLGPLVERGKLPILASMMRDGAWGVLESTIPPHTAPAWTSLATGKNPGRHGVFQFRPVDRTLYREGYRRVVNASSIAGPTLWELLSEADRTVGVMNVPMTYPPRPVKGFMITGMLTPRHASGYVYPPELASELSGYQIDLTVGDSAYGAIGGRNLTSPGALRSLIEELRESVHARAETALRLMRDRPSEFFMVVFTETDRLQHYLWHCLDPDTEAYSTPVCESLRAAAEELYVEIDAEMGRLFRQAGETTTKIVVSDHGFRNYPTKALHVNVWLMEQGLLKLGAGRAAAGKLKYLMKRCGMTREMMLGLANRLFSASLVRRLRRRPRRSDYPIDWAGSRAVYVPLISFMGGIELLLAEGEDRTSREVSAEYEALRSEVMERLRDLRDPETGKPVVASVHCREDIYQGAFATEAPDIIVMLDPDYRGEMSLLARSSVSQHRSQDSLWTGDHSLDGIVLLSGPVIANTDLGTGHIWDIAPTVLHLLGVPIPSDMDGRLMASAVDPDYLADHPVRYCDPGASRREPRSQAGQNWESEGEMEEVADHLRGLGYL